MVSGRYRLRGVPHSAVFVGGLFAPDDRAERLDR
jgi:hypothetical protein